MQNVRDQTTNTSRSTLLVVAAPRECRAVLDALDPSTSVPDEWYVCPLSAAPNWLIIRSGVGKVNAAGATLTALANASIQRVISLGVAGLLPPLGTSPAQSNLITAQPLDIGATIIASHSVYADEGLASPTGYLTTAEMGFKMGPFPDPAVPGSAALLNRLTAILPPAAIVAPIATVSTCSGTDGLAHQVASRTGAVAEAMEGAAVGHIVARWNALRSAESPSFQPVEFAELRVISNTTGDRDRQQWDLAAALKQLTNAVSAIRSL